MLASLMTSAMLLLIFSMGVWRYRRLRSGLPAEPPAFRWIRIVWGVIFLGFAGWVIAGWAKIWFAPR